MHVFVILYNEIGSFSLTRSVYRSFLDFCDGLRSFTSIVIWCSTAESELLMVSTNKLNMVHLQAAGESVDETKGTIH